MEIEVRKEQVLAHYDGGGGAREVSATIYIDLTKPGRMQRQILIYEVLGCCLGYVMPHEEIDELASILVDALDQLGEV